MLRHPKAPTAGMLAILLPSLLAIGCSPRVQFLTDRRYEPRPASQEIDLFEGNAPVAHDSIALLDSAAVDELTTDTQRRLVTDLQRRARRLGADAVADVEMLMRAERGWIRDPYTPFRSWKQGWTDLHFLRGRAVRYRPVEIETGRGETAAGPTSGPAVEASSPDEIERKGLEIFETMEAQDQASPAGTATETAPAPAALQETPGAPGDRAPVPPELY